MKKAMFCLAVFLLTRSVCALCAEEKTGVYEVSIKSMPFWTFWNYDKALKLIAEKTHQSIEDVRNRVAMKRPIEMTQNYEEVEQLKKELCKLHCDLEISEMTLMQFLACVKNANGPKYGICVRNVLPDAQVFIDGERIAAITHARLQCVGMKKESGEQVWAVGDLAEGERLKTLLEEENCSVDIIEIKFDDEPNANVISLYDMLMISKQLEELLGGLVGTQQQ